MVTFLVLARPLILRLAGATQIAPRSFRVAAGFAYRKKPGRREYLRATLQPGPEGAWIAQKFPRDGAGILSSMVDSDGLVVLDEIATDVAPGASVLFLPFREVID
jgi:molybdopterin molybdotransferase